MSLVICESQQFQSTLIQEVMRDYPRIPIEGKQSDVDKITRARAVAAKYEAPQDLAPPHRSGTPTSSGS